MQNNGILFFIFSFFIYYFVFIYFVFRFGGGAGTLYSIVHVAVVSRPPDMMLHDTATI